MRYFSFFKKFNHTFDLKRALLSIFVVLAFILFLNFGYFKEQFVFHSGLSEVLKDEPIFHEHQPNWLYFPRLDIQTPIVFIEEKNEKAYQEALSKGVVHYPGTAMAGEYGNMYIFGHSSDLATRKSPYRYVFALLEEAKAGDEIIVTDSDNNEYLYKVIDTKVISRDNLAYLDQYSNKSRMLTLQTSYPFGTALKRLIVIAQIFEEDNLDQSENTR